MRNRVVPRGDVTGDTSRFDGGDRAVVRPRESGKCWTVSSAGVARMFAAVPLKRKALWPCL
jgi:hypothetical protein